MPNPLKFVTFVGSDLQVYQFKNEPIYALKGTLQCLHKLLSSFSCEIFHILYIAIRLWLVRLVL